MIETSLNVTDYPSPPEAEEKNIGGEITIRCKFETEVPKSWDYEEIKNYIKQNIGEFIDINNYEEIDIEI